MEVIYLLIPLSLVFLVAAIWFFFWAVKSEQYDDLEGPAHRIILDDREKQSDAAALRKQQDRKPQDRDLPQ